MRTLRRGLLAMACVAVACSAPDPRRTVAEAFIDQLFVVIDQQAARPFATGLAVAKLDEEIRLRGDTAIDESTRQPRVTYTFRESRGDPSEEASSLVYDLHVAPEGTDTFTRRLILTVRRVGDAWRVGNYTLEPTAPE